MTSQLGHTKRVFAHDLMTEGGGWLSTARTCVQRMARNGETVIWGSEEPVTLSMRQIETLASEVAARALNDARTDEQINGDKT